MSHKFAFDMWSIMTLNVYRGVTSQQVPTFRA